MNRNFILCPPLFSTMVAVRRSLEKACRTPQIARKTGLYIFTFLSFGGADRRRKIGRIAVPVTAASQIAFYRGADRIQFKSGVGVPETNEINWSHAPGIKLICGPGPQVKIFLHR
jgi:hypothetical protein